MFEETRTTRSNMSVPTHRRGLADAPTWLLLLITAWAAASTGYWSMGLAEIAPEWIKVVNALESPAELGWTGTVVTAGVSLIGMNWLLSTLMGAASAGLIVKRLQAGGVDPGQA